MSVECDGTSTTGLVSSAGATKTFFFVDAAASGSSHGSLQDGGVAPTVASTTTGWTTGTTTTSRYSNLVYATQQGTGTFGSTPLPSGAPTTTNCFRTQTAYAGQFAAGNWAIKVSLIALVAQSGTVHLRLRFWRSTDPTGQTNVTEITTSTLTMGNAANLTTSTAQNTTVTWAAPAFTLTNEYLFCEIALEITVASASGTASCVLRVGNVTPSISSIVTTVFTATMPPLAGTFCAFARATPGPTSGVQCIFTLQDNVSGAWSNACDTQFRIDSATTCSLVVQFSGSAPTNITAVGAIAVGDWVFVACVCDASGNLNYWWAIYGQAGVQFGVTQAMNSGASVVWIQIGVGTDGTGGSGGDQLLGDVGSFFIYTDALNQAQLEKQLSTWEQAVPGVNVWDWWTFRWGGAKVVGEVRSTPLTGTAAHVTTADDPPGAPNDIPTDFNDSIVPMTAQPTLLFIDSPF